MDIDSRFRALENMHALPAPPYWVLLRQFHEAFQTIRLDTTAGEKQAILVLFSGEIQAQRFLSVTGGIDEGWEIARLKDWEHILGFVDAMPDVKYLSFDIKDIPDDDAQILQIETVLPPIRDLLTGPQDV